MRVSILFISLLFVFAFSNAKLRSKTASLEQPTTPKRPDVYLTIAQLSAIEDDDEFKSTILEFCDYGAVAPHDYHVKYINGRMLELTCMEPSKRNEFFARMGRLAIADRADPEIVRRTGELIKNEKEGNPIPLKKKCPKN